MDFGAIEAITPCGADNDKTIAEADDDTPHTEEAGEFSEAGEVSVTFAGDLAEEALDAAAGALAGEASACAD